MTRQTRRHTTRRRAKRTTANSAESFKVKASDVFRRIDERFDKQEKKNDEMRDEIRALGQKIDTQISMFNAQLDKLNGNMERAMATIANHETRIKQLESDKFEKQTQSRVLGQVFETTKKVGTGLLYAMAGIGVLFGIKPLAGLLGFIGK